MSHLHSDISKSNPNYISPHRYQELRHWVMQYYEWNDISSRTFVEAVASEAHPIIGPIILKAVVNNWSYDTALANVDICCGREMWYSLYRRFFKILDTRKLQLLI